MDYRIFLPVLISFALSVILGPVVIPILRKLKMGQTEREDGVKSHLKKAGTPTMGGVIILSSIAITSLFYIKDYPTIIPILFVTVGFGLFKGCNEAFRWLVSEAENGTSDFGDSSFRILYCEIYRDSADMADSVYRWQIS